MSNSPAPAAHSETLSAILRDIANPSEGLPDAVFEFALKIVPMINVDLLVLDDATRVLLAWREDEWHTGWHIPGGIIRVNEHIDLRVQETARLELGTTVEADPAPRAVTEMFGDRGHFISLLYKCELTCPLSPSMLALNAFDRTPGRLWWFSEFPSDLYPSHLVYIDVVNRIREEERTQARPPR